MQTGRYTNTCLFLHTINNHNIYDYWSSWYWLKKIGIKNFDESELPLWKT